MNTRHDVMAEELELKRLKANLKTAEKAGDQRRVSRDRRELYRLEADVRADKADLKDQKQLAKAGARSGAGSPSGAGGGGLMEQVGLMAG